MITKPRKKKQKEDGVEEDENTPSSRKRSRTTTHEGPKKTPKLRPGDPNYDPYDFTSSDEEEHMTRSHDQTDKSHDQVGESMDTGSAETTSRVSMDAER